MCQMDKDILEHFPIPDDILKLAIRANVDLYTGPLYINGEGEACSHLDEGAKAFDFTDACARVSDWCGDNLSTIYYDSDCGEVMEKEPEGEFDEEDNWLDASPYYEVDSSDIKRILFGRELAGHI